MIKVKEDRRADKSKPWGWVVFTDSFLSGWGEAPRRSLYALAVQDHKEAELVLANGKRRSDMKRGRITGSLPRLHNGDHLAIVDRKDAGAWYRPGAFCDCQK